jgi:hypothetical protein
MRLYLAVLEGPSPKDATPIFATEDRELIRAVAKALARRLEGDSAITRILDLTDGSSDGEERQN